MSSNMLNGSSRRGAKCTWISSDNWRKFEGNPRGFRSNFRCDPWGKPADVTISCNRSESPASSNCTGSSSNETTQLLMKQVLKSMDNISDSLTNLHFKLDTMRDLFLKKRQRKAENKFHNECVPDFEYEKENDNQNNQISDVYSGKEGEEQEPDVIVEGVETKPKKKMKRRAEDKKTIKKAKKIKKDKKEAEGNEKHHTDT